MEHGNNEYDITRKHEPELPSHLQGAEPPPSLVADVLLRLGLAKTPVAEPFMALRSPDWRERIRALQAFSEMGIQAPLELLVERLRDEDEHEAVRVAAAQALGKLADYQPVSPADLMQVWDNASRALRTTIIEVLASIQVWAKQSPQFHALLLSALNDREEDVRIAALYAAGSSADQELADTLLEAMNAREWRVREAAVQVLGRLATRGPSQRRALVEALYDASPFVRSAAAFIQRDNLPIEILTADLCSDKPTRRKQAARILGELGRQEALEPLLDIVEQDRDSSMRIAALLALAKLAEQHVHVPKEPLLKAAQDGDQNVQDAALSVLDALYPPPLAAGDELAVPQRLPARQHLKNYLLKGVLAEDAQAIVYLAEPPQSQTEVAIKVSRLELLGESRASFKERAETIARLKHPHIVRIYDIDVDRKAGTPFLVMAYAAHGSTRQMHPRGVCVPLATVVSYVRQAADGLQYAHDQGVVHRNIKPENLLLGDHRELWLSDFGLPLQGHSSPYHRNPPRLSKTRLYMAPECFGDKATFASDQYSLAKVAYEWLCGELPFQGSDDAGTIPYTNTLLPSLRQKNSAIPPAVENVVMKALTNEPEERYPTVLEFAQALAQAAVPPAAIADAPRPEKQRFRGVLKRFFLRISRMFRK